MEAQALASLLGRYGRDIGVDERGIRDALENPIHGTAFKEWVQLHLGDENLLSVDELDLYTSLDKSGVVDQLVASQDLALVHPVSQNDVTTAIEELERSTAAINERTESLKQHQNALAKLVDTSDKARKARSRMDEACLSRQTSERKKLLTTVEELAQALSFQATDLESQATASIDNLRQAADNVLRSDDKLLSSLKKLGQELDPEDPEEKANIEKLRETCMRLIKFTVEVARTKLDRVYLEEIVSAQRNSSQQRVSPDEVRGLQEEVESLYAEILPVAQMSVEQQYLEPALKAVAERNGNTLGRSAEAAAYVNACLDYLVDHMTRLSTHAETIQSHQAAAAGLVEATRTELAVPATPPKKKQVPQQLMSPVRPRSTTYTASAMATPAPSHRRHRSSGAFMEEGPIEALMRLLAIHIPATAGPDAGDAVAVLARSQADRAAKSRDVALNAQESFERAVAAHLGDSRRAIQLLRDSVLAESPFGPEVKLADPEIEASIVVLGQEVAKVRERVGEAEDMVAKGRARKHAGSDKQREMIERWAQ
ncbi:hypothetical protein F5X68DRAFT_45462 [Plectosphaerella plurivora]|uniref:Uncharacterized protein n=1 Tax=Plectosphaerella plurivora TaxID=936078 RepID=A0A9P9AGC2_9PEZI|nr:hypothetical protein F5X68DRAFT_45462 [Plectosphaerella plurivora]